MIAKNDLQQFRKDYGHAIVVTLASTVKMLVEDLSSCFQQFYCLPKRKDLRLH